MNMAKKTTGQLINRLTKVRSYSAYLDENRDELITETTGQYLTRLATEKGLKISDIAAGASQTNYTYKIFTDERHPRRDPLIAIAISMGLELAEAQHLLRISHCAQLDPRNSRDSVIIYGLHRKQSTTEINLLLENHKEELL